MLAVPMDSSALNWMRAVWRKHPNFDPKLSIEQLRKLDACLKEYFRNRASTQTQEARRAVPSFMNVKQEPPLPEDQYPYPRPRTALEEVAVLRYLLEKVTEKPQHVLGAVLMLPTTLGESPLWVERLDDRPRATKKREEERLRARETAQKVWEAVESQARKPSA